MNTLVDATLHDLIVGSQPYHVGVFQAPKDTITHVQNIYNAWASGSSVEAAFTAYPMLRTIFQMLRRPGTRAFVFASREGKTLAIVRANIIGGEHVWFRWLEENMSDAVSKQCRAVNIYGHAITVWSYCIN
jgi:hypothetical protein